MSLLKDGNLRKCGAGSLRHDKIYGGVANPANRIAGQERAIPSYELGQY